MLKTMKSLFGRNTIKIFKTFKFELKIQPFLNILIND
jgi:hypothetical protein